MANELQTAPHKYNSEQLDAIFGSAPVLSTESIDSYKAMVSLCLDSVKPGDFIEQLLVRDIVDASWEIRRYVRHKSWGIERNFRDRVEQLERAEKEEAKKPSAFRVPAGTKEPETDADRLSELEYVIDESVPDVDNIILRKPADLDHARALEAGIEFHEKLDRLLNTAFARRDDALGQLERYRTGLGQHLRQVSSEIIDAEFTDASVGADREPRE